MPGKMRKIGIFGPSMTIPSFFYFCFFFPKKFPGDPPQKKKSGKLRAEKGKIWEFLEKNGQRREKNGEFLEK